MRDPLFLGERLIGGRSQEFSRKILAFTPWVIAGLGILAAPAYAHHPFGGETPANALEGFLSGLGHPVIGFDHLVFVIAIGLLGAFRPKGVILPVAFVVATLLGTGIHLLGWDLPAPELIISASVFILGLLLALGRHLNVFALAGLGALAGLFHGYAYGEAIVGAEITPLLAYLLGFGVIQLAIAIGAQTLAQQIFQGEGTAQLPVRFAGFAILGIGITLLSTFVVG